MREILFRAKTEPNCKDIITGKIIKKPKWIHGYIDLGYMHDGQNALISDTEGNKAYRCQYETIGQYTGLKDKNGKRIFEGDILRWVGPDGESGKVYVKFAGGVFALQSVECPKADPDQFGDFEIGQQTLEIIGNIHENPELLEGGKDAAD